ncbi:MAG: YhcH/YjgK/YiaL family protein [Limnochordia bacterium]|nr:YhcH/YjgK/YiaL family protein [Limnochordia bacterium]MDD2756969.1 YhcH/YjgK/YiaL family protein [Methanothrix sp.]
MLQERRFKQNILRMPKGAVAVFFPRDAHRPGCMWDETETVRKTVVKIKVD